VTKSPEAVLRGVISAAGGCLGARHFLLKIEGAVLLREATPIIAIDADSEDCVSGRIRGSSCLDHLHPCLGSRKIPASSRNVAVVTKTIDARPRRDFESLVLLKQRY